LEYSHFVAQEALVHVYLHDFNTQLPKLFSSKPKQRWYLTNYAPQTSLSCMHSKF